MPIRRAAGTPPQETAPSTAAEGEPDATSEGSPSVEEEEQAASSASPREGEVVGEAEPTENGEAADEAAGEKKVDESGKKGLKDGYKLEKSKVKKVKRTIPAWATMSASKKVPVSIFPGSQPKVDDILIEAIKSCADRSGMSYQSVMKYIVMKYPGLDLDKRKFLIKKALKKQVEKGAVKQLKGKGLSGSFAIGKLPTTKPQAKKAVTAPGLKSESLGDALPLIITRLCEPKEASYILIKKYVEQHFPHLNVESRPDLLKAALIKSVDRGVLERITGKGASGTFQIKRSADKAAKGGPLDDAIVAAITAMNEPKTCSTQTLRKFLVHSNKDSKEGRLVATLRKTLTKCKMLGWMEQITGKGFQGTYQLSFPYYPSPAVLYPDKVIAPPPKKKEKTPKSRWQDDSSDEEDDDDDEEEEEEEEEEDDEPPPPKRKAQKRPAPKARAPPRKKPRTASPSKAKGKRPPPKKRAAAPAKKAATPAKKAATPAKKAITPAKKAPTPAKKTPAKKAATPAKKPAASLKESPSKATPVKKAAPAKKPKTPVAKKMTNRGSKAGSQKSSLEEPAAKKEAKTKPSARRSQRGNR